MYCAKSKSQDSSNLTTSHAGNWSVSKEEYDEDVMPDFCTGFLYVTTPSVGAALVQAGLVMDGGTETEQIEDSLITSITSMLVLSPLPRSGGISSFSTVNEFYRWLTLFLVGWLLFLTLHGMFVRDRYIVNMEQKINIAKILKNKACNTLPLSRCPSGRC